MLDLQTNIAIVREADETLRRQLQSVRPLRIVRVTTHTTLEPVELYESTVTVTTTDLTKLGEEAR